MGRESSCAQKILMCTFLISEVHPFEDGNGRVARLMMNAELTASGQAKIIIPTVYRGDYLLNLRLLTRKHDTTAYIRMMDRAHAFSYWLEPGNYPDLKAQSKGSNAFEEEGTVLVF
ncbi:Fic family protein [Neolewinella persica]|uniref:Fic family protein n=1 Tax=Neolewinella persica TaxID=70998 RepID=UPI0022286357|nr:Fic family protein [Neolewinella persica]